MIEAPETPHRHHTVHRWLDIGLAVAVVLVSLGSLYVSLHTGKTMEQLVEQNARLVRANSVPLLQFDTGNIGDDDRSSEIYLSVRNAGTGPARIVWFELLQDGRPVRNYQDLLPGDAKWARSDIGIVTGGIAPSMMPAGEYRKLVSWPRPKADRAMMSAWDNLNTVRQGLKVEACYCSLFDECWLTSAAADVPRPVATCEIGNRTTFQG
jgi:hypothetical protein